MHDMQVSSLCKLSLGASILSGERKKEMVSSFSILLLLTSSCVCESPPLKYEGSGANCIVELRVQVIVFLF